MVCPKDCSRYNTCSASICPCDPDWDKRVYKSEDRICNLLIRTARDETPKESDAVIEAVKEHAVAIWKKYITISKKCNQK